MAKRRILVADTLEADARLKRILPDHELVFSRTLADAQRCADADGFDLVVIGVHFDDSRMFDLLRFVRTAARHGERPVVCVRSHRFAWPAISVEGLQIAASALACNLFLDLTQYPDDAAGNADARRLIEDLLR
jgi:DNA-binding response OmpR family regulator